MVTITNFLNYEKKTYSQINTNKYLPNPYFILKTKVVGGY